MTNIGKGCQTCKMRRVKCDGARPICQKCTKSRRVCLEPSAARESSLSIHVENRYASGQKKRPRGPRPNIPITWLNVDLETRALAYYLQYHLEAVSDFNLAGGIAQSVSAWRSSRQSAPVVDLALSAMALAVYSRIHECPPALRESSVRYQRLLRLMQSRIAQFGRPVLDSQDIDACLLATTLMGRYENVTHHPTELDLKESFRSLHTWSHHDGAMAILKLWHKTRTSNNATCIIKQTRRGMIKSYFLRSLPLPEWISDGSHFGEEDSGLDYDRIMVRLVNLHCARRKVQEGSVKPTEIHDLNIEALDLDNSLKDWATRTSKSGFFYQQHYLADFDGTPRDHFYSARSYSYTGFPEAAMWGDYFATRMLVNSTRLKILETGNHNSSQGLYEEQRQGCLDQMQQLADSLASTIPFCLERFKVEESTPPYSNSKIKLRTNDEVKPYLASLAVWPLTLVSSAEGLSRKQQMWFRSELSKLGRIVGDSVVACAYTPEWT